MNPNRMGVLGSPWGLPWDPRVGSHGIPGGGLPMGSQGGCPWDATLGPWALATLGAWEPISPWGRIGRWGPMGPWGPKGPWGPSGPWGPLGPWGPGPWARTYIIYTGQH